MFSKLLSLRFKYPFFLLLLSLLAVYLFVLNLRSLQYLYRIVREYIYPVEGYYEDVVPCADSLDLSTDERVRVYRYRSLGAVCEN